MSNPHGHASSLVPPKSAWGICDRCAFVYDLNDLKFQFEYRGGSMINTGSRVCPTCMDKPFTPNKLIKLPPDPVPVKDPRMSLALDGATVEIINGIPQAVGGTVVPVSEIGLEEYE